MATAATKLTTAEEFYAFVHLPENRDRAFELDRGVIVEADEMSRPGKLHGLICANVGGILRNYAIARGRGYVCTNDTGIIVRRDPDSVRGPDVMFFDDAESIFEVDEAFGEKPPLLAVEVLSPHDSPGRVNRRIQEQLNFGTPLVWLLDPDARNVTIFRPGQNHQVLEESESVAGDEVLPDFKCNVAEFFNLPGKS